MVQKWLRSAQEQSHSRCAGVQRCIAGAEVQVQVHMCRGGAEASAGAEVHKCSGAEVVQS